MARTIPWLLLCAGLGIAACFLQLDREARRNHALADNVPAMFRGFALEGMALRALRAEQVKTSLEYATALVRKRPVPSEHLAMLSLAAATANQVELSNQAVLLSARRGWRAPVAQQVIALSAANSGEWTTASDRLMALWRSGVDEDAIGETTSQVLSDPGGRTAFAGRLAQNPASLARFVRWGAEGLEPATFALTLAEALRLGSEVDCEDLGRAAGRLLKSGAGDAALQIWTGPCAEGLAKRPASKVIDWSLRPGEGGVVAGPFDWTYPSKSGLKRSWQEQGSTWVLDYVNRDPLKALLAERYTMLPPGTVRLAVIEQDRKGVARQSAVLRAWCIGADGKRSQLANAIGSVVLEVPREGCFVQFLQLRVSKGKGIGLNLVAS